MFTYFKAPFCDYQILIQMNYELAEIFLIIFCGQFIKKNYKVFNNNKYS